MATFVISARLDETAVAKLDERAKGEGKSRNEYIASILLEHLGMEAPGKSQPVDNVDARIQELVDSAVNSRIQDLSIRLQELEAGLEKFAA